MANRASRDGASCWLESTPKKATPFFSKPRASSARRGAYGLGERAFRSQKGENHELAILDLVELMPRAPKILKLELHRPPLAGFPTRNKPSSVTITIEIDPEVHIIGPRIGDGRSMSRREASTTCKRILSHSS